MNTTHFRWQFQTVCHGSNPFNNSEWANVPWVQFLPLLKSNHSFPRSYFEKHQVTFFEFQFLSSIINITFLSILSHFKPFLDNTNLFKRNLYKLHIIYFSLPHFVPTYKSSTFSPIQGLERCHSNASLIIVVIGKFCQ